MCDNGVGVVNGDGDAAIDGNGVDGVATVNDDGGAAVNGDGDAAVDGIGVGGVDTVNHDGVAAVNGDGVATVSTEFDGDGADTVNNDGAEGAANTCSGFNDNNEKEEELIVRRV